MEKDNRNILKNSPKITIQFGGMNSNLQENMIFGKNNVVTTKYNLVTLFPKSLFLQFKRLSNIYFLLSSILTFMPFSPEKPGSTVATFAFVLLLTMIKEAIQDYSRYKNDCITNGKIVKKHKNSLWNDSTSGSIKPGDFVKIPKDEEILADILIIACSNLNGTCYIDTKNIDGEINLKEKHCIEIFKENSDLNEVQGSIICDAPDGNLNFWEGVVNVNNQLISVSQKNLLLKGCNLKNIENL